MTAHTTDEGWEDRSHDGARPSGRIRVLLVDDHHIIREGVKAVAHAQAGIDIVGEGGSVAEVLPLIRAHRPDVLLLDLQLRHESSIDVIREVRRRYERPRVVVLTSHSEEEYVIAAVSAGAQGYVGKHAEPAQIFEAVRAVHNGRRYIAAEVSCGVFDARDGATFTTREHAVLTLLSRGERNKAIGALLGIAEETVKTHVKNILTKLGATSRTEAARKAIDSRIVKRDD